MKDISPVGGNSTVCFVGSDGSISKTSSILVSDEGCGVVPCISLNSAASISSHTEETVSEIYVYKPTGEVAKITYSEKESYLNSGWYETLEEAEKYLYQIMNDNFTGLSVYDTYAPFVTRYATDDLPIYMECKDENLSATEIIKFLYPLVNDALTGEPSDYMDISVKFNYSKDFVAQYFDFSDDYFDKTLEAVQTCWTGWGGIINLRNSTYEHSEAANLYAIKINMEINRDVNDYYNKLKEISEDARAYSQSQLGQIQYIRHYLAENVEYDSKLAVNNNPSKVLLEGRGVCGSYANAVKDLCIMLDIPCLVVTNKQRMHGWNCLYIENAWYEIDTTSIHDAGYEVNGEYREFTEGKFDDSEAKASNVSFFMEPILDGISVDSITSSEYAFIKNIFQNGLSITEFKNSFTIPDAEDTSVYVVVNGSTIYGTNKPYTENGRMLVPMRKIFEAIGADVSWDSETKTITAQRNGVTAKIQIGSNVIYVGDKTIALDTAARVEGGETYVPVRAVAEAFGADVDWNNITHIATIII